MNPIERKFLQRSNATAWFVHAMTVLDLQQYTGSNRPCMQLNFDNTTYPVLPAVKSNIWIRVHRIRYHVKMFAWFGIQKSVRDTKRKVRFNRPCVGKFAARVELPQERKRRLQDIARLRTIKPARVKLPRERLHNIAALHTWHALEVGKQYLSKQYRIICSSVWLKIEPSTCMCWVLTL